MCKSICDHCQKTFKKQNKLERHINETHLNIKKFQCPTCFKFFKREYHKKRHMILHSDNPKPFEC